MTKKYESKYQSRHNPGKKVTLGQWIAELMCERKAQADENKELPRRFWIEKHKDKESYQKWQPYLKRQVYTAYRLIDQYGRLVDLNNMDFSFSLEITQLYNNI